MTIFNGVRSSAIRLSVLVCLVIVSLTLALPAHARESGTSGKPQTKKKITSGKKGKASTKRKTATILVAPGDEFEFNRPGALDVKIMPTTPKGGLGVKKGNTGLGAAAAAQSQADAGDLLNIYGFPIASIKSADHLPERIQARWDKTGVPLSSLSLLIKEAGGPVVLAINPTTPRNPASVMKMLTTWAALNRLGSQYTWKTQVYIDRRARFDVSQAMRTPLYIKGGGDPALNYHDLRQMIRAIQEKGLRHLSDVIVDRSLFAPIFTDPGDFDGSPERPYNANPDAMMVNLGAIMLNFKPDRDAGNWAVSFEPDILNPPIAGHLGLTSGACIKSRTGSELTGTVQTESGRALQLKGDLSAACGQFSIYRLIGPQSYVFSTIFERLWTAEGGTISGVIRDGLVPERAVLLQTRSSPPLDQVIQTINKYSNNVMAKTLLLTLGQELYGAPATFEKGSQAVLDTLRKQGVNIGAYTVMNGSGLSREGRITAGGQAQMLEAIWASPLRDAFIDSLSVTGVDGTMRRRLTDRTAKGRGHFKTGTLGNASALSGYVTAANGKTYILVSLVNDVAALKTKPFVDALIQWLIAQ
ncbi:D-alanyl-D-alanine carboxypeptidase/D-alanyl-D-alanine-endopeptidase [Advenella sp. S44]|uniref:D-alanyl-D-alanine carboxypeptidase/D-alanyl-D-alanine endopeptidase n=1 Tax=Advenella sp. S44 TaxID=1982755 RepID=UPI001374711F|nr:D-alanyl-D-alanine carboxypeptidase/D-alanyl-D-alanine-endopeptidase [Advenella sp. S44]